MDVTKSGRKSKEKQDICIVSNISPSICINYKTRSILGRLVAPSIKRPNSAQVMISRFTSSSPALDSVLTAQSLEPASDSVSPSLSAPSLLALCVCVCVCVCVCMSQK